MGGPCTPTFSLVVSPLKHTHTLASHASYWTLCLHHYLPFTALLSSSGLAIRDYWGVDDSFVVLVADPNFGDILNFNVGQGVDLEVPRVSHAAAQLLDSKR